MHNKTLLALAAAALLGGCAGMMPGSSWIDLVNGEKGMENFTTVAEANWTARDGAIQATAGGKVPSYLVTRNSYKDYRIVAEFWASDDANSGIFLRCNSFTVIDAKNCYEANIFDTRPDPSYGTGALVDVAKVIPMPKAGGKWNTFDITVRGDHIVLVFNGQKTVDVHDSRLLAPGPIALQWGAGTIKWRKVQIQPL